jgi:hypothetical protein
LSGDALSGDALSGDALSGDALSGDALSGGTLGRSAGADRARSTLPGSRRYGAGRAVSGYARASGSGAARNARAAGAGNAGSRYSRNARAGRCRYAWACYARASRPGSARAGDSRRAGTSGAGDRRHARGARARPSGGADPGASPGAAGHWAGASAAWASRTESAGPGGPGSDRPGDLGLGNAGSRADDGRGCHAGPPAAGEAGLGRWAGEAGLGRWAGEAGLGRWAGEAGLGLRAGEAGLGLGRWGDEAGLGRWGGERVGVGAVRRVVEAAEEAGLLRVGIGLGGAAELGAQPPAEPLDLLGHPLVDVRALQHGVSADQHGGSDQHDAHGDQQHREPHRAGALPEQHDGRGQWGECETRPDEAAEQAWAVSSLGIPVRHGR